MDEGADMLLLEPALFSVDVLRALKQACQVPIAPFSVSGEYRRLRSEGDFGCLSSCSPCSSGLVQIRSLPMPPPTSPGSWAS